MLVNQHPDANARHVKPVEKVLDGALGGRIHSPTLVLLHLDDSLGHRLYYVVVPIPNEIQIGHKPGN